MFDMGRVQTLTQKALQKLIWGNKFSPQLRHSSQQTTNPNPVPSTSSLASWTLTTVSFWISLDFTLKERIYRPSCRRVDISQKAETIMCLTLVGHFFVSRGEQPSENTAKNISLWNGICLVFSGKIQWPSIKKQAKELINNRRSCRCKNSASNK